MSKSNFYQGLNIYFKRRCLDQGCHLKMGKRIRNPIIMNIEEYWNQNHKLGKICDFLILCEYNNIQNIIMSELKSKDPDISYLKNKYENCAIELPSLIQNINNHINNINPILSFNSINPIEARMLRTIKIKIQNILKDIITTRCGSFLQNVLRLL